MLNKMLMLAFTLVILSGGVQAQGQQDPFVGTWKLNLAKSKSDPGPLDRSITVTWGAVGANGMKVTVDNVDGQGKTSHEESTAKFDGKDYPVTGSLTFDSVARKQIDSHTRVTINKKGGNVVRMLRGTVSPDGKTFTSTGIAIDAQGKAQNSVAVFDKQ